MIPEPRKSSRCWASQASRCSGVFRRTTPRRSDSRSSEPRSTRTPSPICSATSLVTRALAVAVVASTGMPVGQLAEQGADAAVVGPEVVAPVGDAVGLVDHEQAGGGGQAGQHGVAEAGVVQPLGADQQHVDLTGGDLLLDRLPLLDVGGVDGHRPDAGALGRSDLVAHQGEQRGDDHRRAGALLAQQERGHEVDRRLAPPGALHHQGPAPFDGQRLDRCPLVVVEHDVLAPHQPPEVLLGPLADVGAVCRRRGHGLVSTKVRRQVRLASSTGGRAESRPSRREVGARRHPLSPARHA